MKTLRIVGSLFLIGIYTSCNNADDYNSQTLSGIYLETSPMNGRSQLKL